MKKIIFFLIFTICITALSAQSKGTAEITGSLDEIQNAKASLIIGTSRIPVEITNGSFSVSTEVEGTEVVRLSVNEKRLFKTFRSGGYAPVKSMTIWIILYPGAKINVTGTISDYANAYPFDGGENDILSNFHKELFPLINRSINIDLELDRDSVPEEEVTRLRKEQETLDSKAQALRISFLEKSISSIAGLWLMDDMVIRSQIEMDEVDRLMNKVDRHYSNCMYYNSLAARVRGYKTTQVGQVAPDILSRATPDSSLFSLGNMKGKYIILDFWGTWCGPCVQGIPHMKEFRDKHTDKLQIVGVAQDRDYTKWKSFVEKNEMNWPNVLVGKGEEDFVLRYNVQGFPTKLLLSPDGIILYRFTGEDESFYDEVAKLIGE